MNQLEVLRESLGQCDEIILDALLMRNRIVEDLSLIHISEPTRHGVPSRMPSSA